MSWTDSSGLLYLVERGLVPEMVLRWGIRRMLAARAREATALRVETKRQRIEDWIRELRQSPIAIETVAANAQHYEAQTRLFETMLGPRLKYSCCLWETPTTTLEQAEVAMLALTCERAGVADGMDLLDLGCGWGSMCLYLAERYPNARVTAVSNSRTQREFIEENARTRGFERLRVITADVNNLDFPTGSFDRVLSIEMFEHVRNYERLLARIGRWLRRDGRLFVHLFCHRDLAYPFGAGPNADWMSRHFFSGGQMPSDELLKSFSRDVSIENHWSVSGRHYAQTLRAWLHRLDPSWSSLMKLFRAEMGSSAATVQLHRWRIFLIACEELFDFNGGNEWFVSHYLFAPRSLAPAAPTQA